MLYAGCQKLSDVPENFVRNKKSRPVLKQMTHVL